MGVRFLSFSNYFVWTSTNAGSSNVWCGGGQPWSHSTFVAVASTERTSRLAEKASQIINRNNTMAIKDMREPIDETVFHRVYASG